MKKYIIELSSDDENALSIITKAYNLHELIRCKDCKHGQYEEWDNGECVDKTVYCDGYGIHKPDWFCADGERREYVKPPTESATDWNGVECE